MRKSNAHILRWIAVFKFFKALTLIAVGVGALRLVHGDAVGKAAHWIEKAGFDPGGHYVDLALGRLANVSPHRLKELGLGSFVYAALFLIEGTGLWLEKRWGEWVTVIITGSLVPLELFELVRRPTVVKGVVLLLNVAVVIYLVLRIRRERAD